MDPRKELKFWLQHFSFDVQSVERATAQPIQHLLVAPNNKFLLLCAVSIFLDLGLAPFTIAVLWYPLVLHVLAFLPCRKGRAL